MYNYDDICLDLVPNLFSENSYSTNLNTCIIPICRPFLINVNPSTCPPRCRYIVTQIRLTTEPSLVPTFPG